jgi:hypothetical protein
VLRRFGVLMIDPRLFGFFFPLVLCVSPRAVLGRGGPPLLLSAVYVVVMMVPFLFLWRGGSPELPIQWSGHRILLQTVPLLSLVLCESGPVWVFARSGSGGGTGPES